MIKFVNPQLPEFYSIRFSLEECFNSKMLTNGDYVRQFEEKLAEYFKVKKEQVVCVNSATTGLILVLTALGLSWKGKRIAVPALGFMSTLAAIYWNNCEPVFLDVNEHTWNVSVNEVDRRYDDYDAILCFHLFGGLANIVDIQSLITDEKPVIYDCAHSFGAKYVGLHICKWGDVSVYSLGMQKIMPCGEGGIIVCKDKKVAEIIKEQRHYGNDGKWDCFNLGLNGKMQEFNAILGLKQLEFVDRQIKRRGEVVDKYKEQLEFEGISFQEVDAGDINSYAYCVIRIEKKKFDKSADEVKDYLEKKEIEARRMYPVPLNKLRIVRAEQECPVAEKLSGELLTLPIGVGDKEIEEVCGRIKEVGDGKIKRSVSPDGEADTDVEQGEESQAQEGKQVDNSWYEE